MAPVKSRPIVARPTSHSGSPSERMYGILSAVHSALCGEGRDAFDMLGVGEARVQLGE